MFRPLAIICFISVVYSDDKSPAAVLPPCGKAQLMSMVSQMAQGVSTVAITDCMKKCGTPVPAAAPAVVPSRAARAVAPVGPAVLPLSIHTAEPAPKQNGTCMISVGIEALNSLSKCVVSGGIVDFPNATELMTFLSQNMGPQPTLCPDAASCLKTAVTAAAGTKAAVAQAMQTCNPLASKNIICGCGKTAVEQFRAKFDQCSTGGGPSTFDQYAGIILQICDDHPQGDNPPPCGNAPSPAAGAHAA